MLPLILLSVLSVSQIGGTDTVEFIYVHWSLNCRLTVQIRMHTRLQIRTSWLLLWTCWVDWLKGWDIILSRWLPTVICLLYYIRVLRFAIQYYCCCCRSAKPTRSTQLCLPVGSLNWVLALLGKRQKCHLCWVTLNTVISIRCVSSRSSVATLRTAIPLLFYLLPSCLCTGWFYRSDVLLPACPC